MKCTLCRVASAGALLLPLVVALGSFGCDSPTGPKFPDPIVKDDTVTSDNEGLTSGRSVSHQPVPVTELRRALEAYLCRAGSEACR